MEHLSRRRFLKSPRRLRRRDHAPLSIGSDRTRRPRPPTHRRPATTTVPTFCDMCFWRCAGIAHVRDGRLGNSKATRAIRLKGRLCPRGTGAVGAYYDPDRLQKPLIRRGPRGREQWTAVTWDEALTYIADKMQKIKTNTARKRWRDSTHGIGQAMFQHVLKSWGAMNFAGSSFAQCRGPARRRLHADVRQRRSARPSRPTSRHRMPGADRLAPGREHAQHAGAGIRPRPSSGAPVIVVDPRFSVAASKAKYWLPRSRVPTWRCCSRG